MTIGIVIIGRNEGLRLVECLKSLGADTLRIVYVDSGSRDDSIANAKAYGADVVELNLSQPFTAARARNAGLRRLLATCAETNLVQFVDGDCALQPGWLTAATDYLEQHPEVAAVCGRLRERFPNATIYNAICDAEWERPPGETNECGGNAMFRTDAISAVGAYREDLIAGEEPELCLRLRENGHKIVRLDHQMGLHDAAMTTFQQWWKRSARTGYAYANVVSLHARSPKRIWLREMTRSLAWGLGLPVAAVIAAVFLHPAFLALLLLYPLQVWRIARTFTGQRELRWQYAALMVLGKFAEAKGVATFIGNRVFRRSATLIEYK